MKTLRDSFYLFNDFCLARFVGLYWISEKQKHASIDINEFKNRQRRTFRFFFFFSLSGTSHKKGVIEKIALAREVSPSSEGSRGASASEDNDRALVVGKGKRLASFAPASLELTYTYTQEHAHKQKVTHTRNSTHS